MKRRSLFRDWLLPFATESFGVQTDDEQKLGVIGAPNEGVQPEVVVETTGIVPMIYFKGKPGQGDVIYFAKRTGV